MAAATTLSHSASDLWGLAHCRGNALKPRKRQIEWPNITGTILGAANDGRYFTGAFSRTGDGPSKTYRADSGVERYNSAADFYASRSSGVYGNSSTVQPSAMASLILIKF